MRNDIPEEDFSNLGLFLNRLKTHYPAAKRAILAGLRTLYDGITDFEVAVQDRTLQVFFTEGDFVIPATRLSDGTLRYLCLLAILCDPSPPPLICIEEPELGLHPDILVDAMTELPESVIVCEKHAGITEMKRLSKTDLAVWLDEYRPGRLWIDGQPGGKRW
jgi:predicted ATPase